MAIISLLLLAIMSVIDSLLFHSLIELFAVVMLVCISIFCWFSSEEEMNGFYWVIGISSGFGALIKIFHLLSYAELGLFADTGFDLPAQLWIAQRFQLALSSLLGLLWLKRAVKPGWIIVYNALFLLSVVGLVFAAEYSQLTTVISNNVSDLELASQVVVSLIFFADIYFLYRNRAQFLRPIYIHLVLFFGFLILSGFSYVFGADLNSWVNRVGHLFDLVATYVLSVVFVNLGFVMPMQRIRAQEHDFRVVLEEIPDTIFLLDRGGNYQQVFLGQYLTELDASRFIGHNYRDFLKEEVAALRTEAIELALTNGQPETYEGVTETINGLILREETVIPISDDRVVLIVRDITERKKNDLLIQKMLRALRSSESMKSSLLNHLIRGGYLIDEDMNVLWSNDVDENELSHEEIIGKPCQVVFSCNQNDCDQCIVRQAFRSGVLARGTHCKTAHYLASPVMEAGVLTGVLLYQDPKSLQDF
ncbi:MAG: PAS domain-containing protein [Anaerolineaceae bacterium]|nr:PAS domain-containing protein [Anaerolineaceae bacterium]